MIIVPWKRTIPRWSEVRISAPVRGRLWRDTAQLYHWLRAHGVHLIPAHSPGIVLAPTESRELRYRVRPSGRAIARVWSVATRCDQPVSPGTSNATAKITYPDAHVETYRPEIGSLAYERMALRFYVEPLAAKSASVTELVLTIEALAGADDLVVENVCCWELPRAALELDAVDLGVELETLRTGQPIFDDDEASLTGNRGLGPLLGNLEQTEVKRTLLQLSFTRASTAGTVQPIDLLVHPVPITPRLIFPGDTEASVSWEIYARVTAADTVGDIVIATSVETQTITIDGSVDGTAMGWYAGPSLLAACEDITSADGRPGGVGETVQVTLEVTAGTGQIEIEGISVCE